MDCWYFAYGSNLLRSQMVARTGSVRAGDESPRIARLPDYRLAFNMQGGDGQVYANIAQPGDGVLGVLYRCEPEAMVKLDAYERGYDRHEVEVFDEAGLAMQAIAYIAKPERLTEEARPSAAYLQKIVTGASEHGLPGDYIRAISALALG